MRACWQQGKREDSNVTCYSVTTCNRALCSLVICWSISSCCSSRSACSGVESAGWLVIEPKHRTLCERKHRVYLQWKVKVNIHSSPTLWLHDKTFRGPPHSVIVRSNAKTHWWPVLNSVNPIYTPYSCSNLWLQSCSPICDSAPVTRHSPLPLPDNTQAQRHVSKNIHN